MDGFFPYVQLEPCSDIPGLPKPHGPLPRRQSCRPGLLLPQSPGHSFYRPPESECLPLLLPSLPAPPDSLSAYTWADRHNRMNHKCQCLHSDNHIHRIPAALQSQRLPLWCVRFLFRRSMSPAQILLQRSLIQAAY